MDIVTLGAALNGSAEYVNSHFKGGSNIQIVDNPDGTQTINASGEVSAEDTVARAEIAAIKDGETLDSFGDVETALGDKADEDNVYKLALSNADLLPNNTDLDNLKTAGCYYIYESVNVTTITHRPTGNTSAFRVTVELAAGKNRPRQIYQEFNSYDRYMRYETSDGTWANWKKVECDLSTKQDTISDLSTIRSGAALGATAVQPETGKGLSTNDYTTAEKTKLAGIAEGAEVNEIESIKVNNTTINPDANKVVNITVPTTAADVSALPDTTKYAVALSLTINSSTFVITGQLKDQNGDNLGTAQTIDLPLESVVVGGSYNSQTKKVVLTLQNGNTIEFSVADLVSGLQTELSTSNKLNPAYINYDSTHRAVSDTEKSTWNGKQDALTTSQLAAVNSGIDSAKVAQIATNASDISDIQAQADWNTDNGVKNLLDFETWKSLPITRGTSVISGNSITLTATSDNCCTPHTVAGGFPENAKIYVKPNTTYKFTWDCDATASKNGQVYIFPNDTDFVYSFANSKVLSFTTTANTTYLTFRIGVANAGDSITYSNLMIRPALISDTTYQPYAMSNAELTAVKQNALSSAQLAAVNSGITPTDVAQIEANKNNISLVLNADGQKNKWDFANAPSGVMQNVIINKQADSLTITSNGTWAHIIYGCQNLPAGEYVLQCEIADYSATTETCKIGHEANPTTLTPVTGNGIITHTFTKSTGSTSVQNIYFYVNWSGTSNTSNTYKATKIMICEKSLYDISSSHQNYAMTNAELTAKAAIEDISSKIIATSGYTVNSLTKLYKQNNRIFGQVVISKDTGSFGATEEIIAEFSSGYRPKDIQIQSCFFGPSVYNVEYTGYTYIQHATATSGAGSVIVKAYQSVGTVVNIHVDFAI